MPPDFDGNSEITTYQVEQLQEGLNEWQPIIQQPKTTFVIKTLEPSTSYQFRISAYNDCGSSAPSEASSTVFTKPVTKGELNRNEILCMHNSCFQIKKIIVKKFQLSYLIIIHVRD